MSPTPGIPQCPNCGANVYRSHTCRAPSLHAQREALAKASTSTPPAPVAVPRRARLATMPDDFREQLARARVEAQLDDAPTLLDDHSGEELVTPAPRLDVWARAFREDVGL